MKRVNFLTRFEAVDFVRGRSVAVVGGGPSVLENEPGFIDSFDLVVRVNNYRTGLNQGFRTDIFYSYFGGAIRKTVDELKADGVTLCWCKCPNGKPIDSDWHERTGRTSGIDFRYIYALRQNWWFCDTYIPTNLEFRRGFELLGGHIPTTGFAAILEMLDSFPSKIYLTGFDFFSSRLHNVDETWNPGNPADPIGHDPAAERDWIARNVRNYAIGLDNKLKQILSASGELVS